jgi:hypothetical protein
MKPNVTLRLNRSQNPATNNLRIVALVVFTSVTCLIGAQSGLASPMLSLQSPS